MNRRRLATIASWLAALGGVGLFVWLFTSTDVLSGLAQLPAALWFAPLLIVVPASLGAVSFARSIPLASGSVLPPFWAMFTIRLAGEAVNNGLASAYVAGEPVKGLLAVRYGVKPTAGLASAIIGKTTTTAGEILFLLLGIGFAVVLFGGETPVVTVLLTVTSVGIALVVLGVTVQRKRLLGRGVRLLHAVRLGPRSLWNRALPGADAIDAEIDQYYRTQKRDFVLASLWGAGGWLFGALELWAFLSLATDVSDPWAVAIAMEAGVAVVKGMSFFVPASIGAQEGGIVWLFGAIGLGTDLGVTYAVFRRFRELIWIGLGFFALGWHLRQGVEQRDAPATAEGA